MTTTLSPPINSSNTSIPSRRIPASTPIRHISAIGKDYGKAGGLPSRLFCAGAFLHPPSPKLRYLKNSQ